MNQRGNSQLYHNIISIFLILTIVFTATSWVVSKKDGTNYNLKFYAKDLAFGIEGMLWSEGSVSYVYPMKENYEIKINNDAGNIFVKNNNVQEKYSFRTRHGYYVIVTPYQEIGSENSYVIRKMERETV